jgi:hypothetical protein
MKAWHLALSIAGGAAALAVAGGVVLWRDLTTEWTIETEAAQYTLDHSPIQHIDRHTVFTASGVEQVFTGTDALGVPWTVFVAGPPWSATAVKSEDLLRPENVIAQALRQGYHVQQCTPGYLNDAVRQSLHVSSFFVYELRAVDTRDQSWDVLVDAKSGQWVWKYLLST